MDVGFDFGHGIFDSVFGNIETVRFQTGQNFSEIVYEKAFAASDVEDFIAFFESVVFDELFGKGDPSAIVFVAAISVFTVAVEIVFVEAFGDGGAFGFVVFEDALDVVAFGGFVDAGDEVDEGHGF